jgi:hypothetical protein
MSANGPEGEVRADCEMVRLSGKTGSDWLNLRTGAVDPEADNSNCNRGQLFTRAL